MNLEEQDLLAKKDLLTLTGISYGQLYRWKRQNLIPESWFIKQSTYTGQETFFPKDKVLQRVKTILELKDHYSLEELAEIFSPELTNKLFKASSLEQIEDLDQSMLDLFIQHLAKDNFTFRELLFVYALGKLDRSLKLGESWRSCSVTTVKRWLTQLNRSNYQLLVCQSNKQKFNILIQEGSTLLLDTDSQILADLKLNELANELHNKLSSLEK